MCLYEYKTIWNAQNFTYFSYQFQRIHYLKTMIIACNMQVICILTNSPKRNENEMMKRIKKLDVLHELWRQFFKTKPYYRWYSFIQKPIIRLFYGWNYAIICVSKKLFWLFLCSRNFYGRKNLWNSDYAFEHCSVAISIIIFISLKIFLPKATPNWLVVSQHGPDRP